MPVSWDEIESSPKYSGLPIDQQAIVKQGWFNDNIATTPKWQSLDDSQRKQVWDGFLNDRGGIRKPTQDDGLIVRGAKDIASGALGTIEGALGVAQWVSGSESAKKAGDWVKQLRTDLMPEDPTFLDELASGAGSMATFFIPGIGISRSANIIAKVGPKLASWFGLGAASVMESGVEAGTAYRDVMSETSDKKKASDVASKVFAMNAALVTVTNKLGIFGEGGSRLRRMVMSAFVEGGQEMTQDDIQAFAQGKPMPSLGERGRTFTIGAILGAGVTGLTPNRQEPQQREDIPESPEIITEKPQEAPQQPTVDESIARFKSDLERGRLPLEQAIAIKDTAEGELKTQLEGIINEYQQPQGEVEKPVVESPEIKTEPIREATETEINDFADRLVAGEKMKSPADLQFYENNKSEIEKRLKSVWESNLVRQGVLPKTELPQMMPTPKSAEESAKIFEPSAFEGTTKSAEESAQLLEFDQKIQAEIERNRIAREQLAQEAEQRKAQAPVEPQVTDQPQTKSVPPATPPESGAESVKLDRRKEQRETPDRRIDIAHRKYVNEMTDEEKTLLLKTDVMTKLPNKRSFDEDYQKTTPSHVARMDMDNLHNINKWLNYEGADYIIKQIANIAKKSGIKIYREKGDEFIAMGSKDDLENSMKRLTDELSKHTIEYVTPDGTTYIFTKGIGVSHGIGENLNEAESNQKQSKQKRSESGQRAEEGDRAGTVIGLAQKFTPRRQDKTTPPKEQVIPAEPQAKVESGKTQVGSAWVNGQRKPVIIERQITRGKNKGRWKVFLTRGRDASGNVKRGVGKIIAEKDIVDWGQKEATPKPKESKTGKPKNVKIGVVAEGIGATFKKFQNLKTTHLTEYPNGKIGFVGAVDGRLAYQTKDGGLPTDEQLNKIRGAQSVSMAMNQAGLKGRSFDTPQEAVEFAQKLNIEVIDDNGLLNKPIKKKSKKQSDIIATDTINGVDYEYRVAPYKDESMPQMTHHVEMRRVGSEQWEHAMTGYSTSRKDALRHFAERYERHGGDISSLNVIDEKLKSFTDKEISTKEKAEQERRVEQEKHDKESERIAKEVARMRENNIVIEQQMKGVRAKKRNIRLKYAEGAEAISTTEVFSIGDYGYHKTEGKSGYTVTHIPSGYSMGNDFSRQEAREITYRYSLLGKKWNGKGKPPNDFVESAAEVRTAFRNRELIEVSQIKSTLKSQTGSSQMASDIFNHAVKLKQQGIKNFTQFKVQMRKQFSEVWYKIKTLMRSLWRTVSNQRGMVEVWHGSPHEFDKFSTEKIGTGEGAQAFGYGLYFTDRKEIAEYYSKQLGDTEIKEWKVKGIPIYQKGNPVNYQSGDTEYSQAKALLQEHLMIEEYKIRNGFEKSSEDGLKAVQTAVDDLIDVYDVAPDVNDPWSHSMQRYFKAMRPKKISDIKWDTASNKYTYKATLFPNRTDEVWLDWGEKPSQELIQKIQSRIKKETTETDEIKKLKKDLRDTDKFFEQGMKKVGERAWQEQEERASNLRGRLFELTGDAYGESKLQRIGSVLAYGDLNGNEIYHRLVRTFGSPKQASLFLKRAGIDGIRYPAGSLSGGGEGTNYVVFDENDIRVDSINGIAKALGNQEGSSQLAADIFNKAVELKESGITKFHDFQVAMRQQFKDVWDKIKGLIRNLWNTINNQRGSIEIEGKKTTKETPPKDVSALYEQYFGKQPVNVKKAQPISKEQTEQPIENTIDLTSYESVKDVWFGKKDLRKLQNKVEAEKLQSEIKNALDVKRYGKQARDTDRAIQIYIDLKENPSHLEKYYDKLTEEQKRIVDLSQNLSPEIKKIADKIADSYKKIGLEALGADVIKNVKDNYAARIWDFNNKRGSEAGRKFGTTTRHAKERKFETILEGWADSRGLELKVGGATNNLQILKDEIINTIQDKKFLKQLLTLSDAEGNPLVTTKQLDGYIEIDHPNFIKWEPIGKADKKEDGTVKWYGKNSFADENGTIWERKPLYAQQDIAKNLNNILGVSKLNNLPGIRVLTKYNAIFKSWILQSSFFHHLAFMRSYYLGTNHKKWSEMKIRKAYKEGYESVLKMEPMAKLAVKNGLTLGVKQDWNETLLQEKTAIGRILDKVGATRKIKDKILMLREMQADFLFNKFGTGLKMKSFEIEYRNQLKKYPNVDPDIIAKRVARLINDDFGGLHLGRLGRNPTAQHIFRILALAPDWTESNVRTMVKTIRAGSKAERAMYRRFWAGILWKGIGATVLANFIMAGGDLDDLEKKYKKAWKAGNLRWLDIDITPIYKALGGESENHKYFSILGHFKDPAKFLLHPVRSAHHKGSVAYKTIHEALVGTNWAGQKYTTLDELANKGRLTKYGPASPLGYSQLPSYLISQTIGAQPVQVQNLIRFINGEMEGFDALANSMGLAVTTTYSKKKK